MKSQKFLIVLMLFFTVNSFAQNARFSQIGTAAIQFNPSLTGRFDGKIRLSALSSWQETNAASMEHQNVSLDAKFGKYKSSGDDESTTAVSASSASSQKEGKDEVYKKSRVYGYWGAGLNYYHYGNSKSPLDAKFFSASIARHFYNKSNKMFGFGIQATYAEGKLDETKGSEYDREISGGGFRYPFTYAVDPQKGSNNYIDFNGGGYYGMVTDAVMFEIGGAMHHLAYPKNDPRGNVDNESKLRHRVTAHSILRLRLNKNWGIVQKNMYWQEGMYYRSTKLNGDSAQIVAFWSGIEFYKVNPVGKINVNYGIYTRNFQTIMPYLNINLGKIANLRYSYEMPINSKKYTAYTANRNEVALIFTYKRYTSPGTRFYKKVNFW